MKTYNNVRFGSDPAQKEKGGVESPPFALLPNCYYIKKLKNCKGKSVMDQFPITRARHLEAIRFDKGAHVASVRNQVYFVIGQNAYSEILAE